MTVMTEKLYNIVRFYFERNSKEKIVDWGLTLEEAQEHCQREDTMGAVWFDAYREAEPCINKRKEKAQWNTTN
jgi:hypothetical protein